MRAAAEGTRAFLDAEQARTARDGLGRTDPVVAHPQPGVAADGISSTQAVVAFAWRAMLVLAS